MTSERQKKNRGRVEDKRNNWRQRKCLHLWSRYCSTQTNLQSLTIALRFLPIVFPSPPHACSLSILRDFPSLLPSLCLALSSLSLKTRTVLDTHIHLSPHLSIPSLPSQLSWLPLFAPTNLLQVTIAGVAVLKGQRAPSERTHSQFIMLREHAQHFAYLPHSYTCRLAFLST